MPGAKLEQMQWFNDLQRMTASPDNALRLRAATADIDIRPLLASVQCPTLCLHARGDAAVRYERGLALAAGIPNARFVTLESDNHLMREDEPAWQKFLDEVRRFLAEIT